MASKNTPAVLDDEIEATEPTTKSVINDAIAKVIEATGIDVQKNRYKAMRAIAFEAFAQAIEAGTFDDLGDSAIANIDELPAGWESERTEKAVTKAPAKAKATPAKAASKAAPTKAPATKTATTAARPARRRPTR